MLEREQHLTQLDGLAAAAAHELGTPLSTIVLISRELEQSVAPDSPMAADLTHAARAGAALPRNPRQDLAALDSAGAPFDRMPVSTLIEESVAPHRDFGIDDQGADRGDRGSPSR